MSRLTLVVLGACIAMAAAGCTGGHGHGHGSGSGSGSGCQVGNGVPYNAAVEAGFEAALDDNNNVNYDNGYDGCNVDDDIYNGPRNGYSLGHTPHGKNHHGKHHHHKCGCGCH